MWKRIRLCVEREEGWARRTSANERGDGCWGKKGRERERKDMIMGSLETLPNEFCVNFSSKMRNY